MWNFIKLIIGLSFAVSLIVVIVMASNENKKLEDLRVSNPEAFLEKVKGQNKLQWMRALKEIKPDAYNIELDKLEDAAKRIPASEITKNIDAYKYLAKLEPDNKFYADKVSYYKGKLEDLSLIHI